MSRFQNGYIPDREQEIIANSFGHPSDRQLLRDKAVQWDATDQPPVTSWDSWADYLATAPEREEFFQWWKACDVQTLFYNSQLHLPCCTGFAMSNATTATLIHQIAQKFSEQKAERINPMATWTVSKNGSTKGGQTISAIMRAGNEGGNYTDAVAGTYNCQNRFDDWASPEQQAEAAKRQIGIALFEGHRNELGEAIVLAQRLGHAVVVGNENAVSNTKRDANGVAVAQIWSRWMHATAFAGYQKREGEEYVFWINSHGNIYHAEDGTPDFGCWMSRKILERFLSGVYCDACFITYAEAPFDETIHPTLEIA
jgi:hypothetical protein